MTTQKHARVLYKNGIIASMDEDIGNLPVGDVLVEDDHIVSIGPEFVGFH
ncbi:hypothetical protein [Acidisoma silvae]|uniref:Uncharacterized protein n=1 Tax=Acidisoma silvae TaxID=2802396 RepID=A0A963YVT1_9PROT|nr:hypothetical protein [Acidisoma silvae]MCB8877841.1 hypothetical protein [Acidisoma silvae]